MYWPLAISLSWSRETQSHIGVGRPCDSGFHCNRSSGGTLFVELLLSLGEVGRAGPEPSCQILRRPGGGWRARDHNADILSIPGFQWSTSHHHCSPRGRVLICSVWSVQRISLPASAAKWDEWPLLSTGGANFVQGDGGMSCQGHLVYTDPMLSMDGANALGNWWLSCWTIWKGSFNLWMRRLEKWY